MFPRVGCLLLRSLLLRGEDLDRLHSRWRQEGSPSYNHYSKYFRQGELYSRAQRYGFRESIFGRAHVSRLNALFFDSSEYPLLNCVDIVERKINRTATRKRISMTRNSDYDQAPLIWVTCFSKVNKSRH